MAKRVSLRLRTGLWYGIVILVAGLGLAKAPAEETILLAPVQIDTPFFKRLEANEQGATYSIKMVKIREVSNIITPPVTTANILYYGEIKLGLPPVNYGILMDLEGKDKLLWVDSDGDRKYDGEKPYQLYKSDRYPGINVYYAPMPLLFKVKYMQAVNDSQITLAFDLPYLIVAQSGFNDFFCLKTRTWFTGAISAGGDGVRLAIVDSNDNGFYNDPEDLIFIDADYDLNFTVDESNPLKSFKSFRLNSTATYRIEYPATPDKLILRKE
ncbi:MAG: hypothetical protein K6U80_09755 [Firmicutes bacterium]|nr:hypothetical protein [Bacillota bacterium]